jgi:uncharacterized protein YjiS (DUF1127 family)
MEQAMSMMSLTVTSIRSRHLPQWSEFRALFIEWRQRVRSRRELMMLSERDLSDMGLTPMDAFNETCKPFWEA